MQIFKNIENVNAGNSYPQACNNTDIIKFEYIQGNYNRENGTTYNVSYTCKPSGYTYGKRGKDLRLVCLTAKFNCASKLKLKKLPS